MKKNKLSFVTLLLSTALMIACSGQTSKQDSSKSSSNSDVAPSSESSIKPISTTSINSSTSQHYDDGSNSSSSTSSSTSETKPSSSNPSSSEQSSSSIPSISSSEISSSIDSSSSSSEPIVVIDNSLDGQIAQLLEGLGLSIPSLNEYNLSFTVLYYYSYESYMIVAQGNDNDGEVEKAYLNKVKTETDLVSENDDDYYPVESYGYLYADSDGNVSINFYTENNLFNFTLSRNDGEAGDLDVSNVDTSWYVDYINFQGFTLLENLPVNDIKESLELDADVTLPTFEETTFITYFEEETQDEDGNVYPATFYLLFEGDQISSLLDFLKTAGMETRLEEKTDTRLNWDTYEVEEYKYYEGHAYDANKSIYISIFEDNTGNTLVAFNKFSALFNGEKTTNTDWSDEEKELMNVNLHQLLPFLAFGNDYELIDDSDEDWNVLYLSDTYYEDLSEDYIALLLAAGFVEYDDPDYGVLYKYDNGLAYLEIFVYYEGGNCLEIYFEDSKIPAVTALSLNETALDIVAGTHFQLTANITPKDGNNSLTWASNNEDVATVSSNGLVSINENAAIDSTATITVTALSGVSASCTFTVKANEVTAIKFKQANYNLVPGGDLLQTQYITLPVGATSLGEISYNIEDNGVDSTGIYIDGYGKVWANSSVEPGTVITIRVGFNDTIYGYATVTIISSAVTHTLNRDFFGIEKANYSKYLTYKKTTDDGATYEATCAGTNGIQIRSKSNDSGVIGHLEDRNCKSITFTFDASTEVPNKERRIDIYASNSAFSIADMFGSSVTKVGSIIFDKNNLTQTYTFTSNYSYIGFRSNDGAVYLPSIEIIWG